MTFGWVHWLVEIPQAMQVHIAPKMSMQMPYTSKLSRSGYLEYQSDSWSDSSPRCLITPSFYQASFGVSKPKNKLQENQCVVEEHCFQHLSLALLAVVHGVGLWASPWRILCMILRMSGSIILNISPFGYYLAIQKIIWLKPM